MLSAELLYRSGVTRHLGDTFRACVGLCGARLRVTLLLCPVRQSECIPVVSLCFCVVCFVHLCLFVCGLTVACAMCVLHSCLTRCCLLLGLRGVQAITGCSACFPSVPARPRPLPATPRLFPQTSPLTKPFNFTCNSKGKEGATQPGMKEVYCLP